MAEIHTRKGDRILVDDEDYTVLSAFAWCTSNGYAMRKTPRREGHRSVRMHRQILGLSFEDPRHVDHVNGDTLDNRKCNLRICSRAENMRNMVAHKDNATGFKGVCVSKNGRLYAQICVDRKVFNLGTFDTSEQ